MDKNYKVAICGAHSQGKTTLVNALKQEVYLSSELKFSYSTNLTRNISKLIPINEAGNSVSQYLIMSKHLEFALTPGRIILDRSALDGIAYTHYFYDKGTVDAAIMESTKRVYEMCLPFYNKIFYIAPELPLTEDGQRSVNKEFFDGVVEQFNFYINHFSVSKNVIFLTGTVEERIATVINEIKKDFNK
jgi:predicted ATPase